MEGSEGKHLLDALALARRLVTHRISAPGTCRNRLDTLALVRRLAIQPLNTPVICSQGINGVPWVHMMRLDTLTLARQRVTRMISAPRSFRNLLDTLALVHRLTIQPFNTPVICSQGVNGVPWVHMMRLDTLTLARQRVTRMISAPRSFRNLLDTLALVRRLAIQPFNTPVICSQGVNGVPWVHMMRLDTLTLARRCVTRMISARRTFRNLLDTLALVRRLAIQPFNTPVICSQGVNGVPWVHVMRLDTLTLARRRVTHMISAPRSFRNLLDTLALVRRLAIQPFNTPVICTQGVDGVPRVHLINLINTLGLACQLITLVFNQMTNLLDIRQKQNNKILPRIRNPYFTMMVDPPIKVLQLNNNPLKPFLIHSSKYTSKRLIVTNNNGSKTLFLIQFHPLHSSNSIDQEVVAKLAEIIQDLFLMAKNRQDIKPTTMKSGKMQGIGFRGASDEGAKAGTYARRRDLPQDVIEEDNRLWDKLRDHNRFLCSRVKNFSFESFKENAEIIKEFGIPSWSHDEWNEFEDECNGIFSSAIVTHSDFSNDEHMDDDLNPWSYGLFSYINPSTGVPIVPNSEAMVPGHALHFPDFRCDIDFGMLPDLSSAHAKSNSPEEAIS
ncbi:hypothetical protein PtA15_7A770 [Puccinia triticina]|uniref:Tet-like 2OG-Fe(II) oxygenase domain-containing protein n=1 Tax=Puccinia triticina TaxID=208348 RepID=A0ABY7CSF0_9BASI|nr:uncharacterized protein PtA15_7A770 [Puccinia triticina]WAQ87041.1 hypothetical protein PtA15_7A770 [Puccinia triticina]